MSRACKHCTCKHASDTLGSASARAHVSMYVHEMWTMRKACERVEHAADAPGVENELGVDSEPAIMPVRMTRRKVRKAKGRGDDLLEQAWSGQAAWLENAWSRQA